MSARDQLDRGVAPAWIAEKAGDTIEGELVRYEQASGQFGEETIAVIATAEGERALWLFGAVLKEKFGKLRPQPGEGIAVRFDGTRESANGFKYKAWAIAVDRPDKSFTPDFDALAQAATGDPE